MEGILLYDDASGRYIVQERINSVITPDSRTEDLHCGDTLQISVKKGAYLDTRIEKDLDDDVFGWYFVGVDRAAALVGHSVII